MLHGDAALNELSGRIIQCAIEVHRELGLGLLESVYETALGIELRSASIEVKRQVAIPLYYKGHLLCEYRVDLIVDDRVVVEVKSVERLDPVFTAKVLTYLKITNLKLGLLLNFNTAFLKQGIRRVMN